MHVCIIPIETTQVSPTWNFQKYLFDHTGKFIKSWDANTSIESIFDAIKTVVDRVPVNETQKDDEETNKIEL